MPETQDAADLVLIAGDVSQAGKVFDSLDAARCWAKENNVCIADYRRRGMGA